MLIIAQYSIALTFVGFCPFHFWKFVCEEMINDGQDDELSLSTRVIKFGEFMGTFFVKRMISEKKFI